MLMAYEDVGEIKIKDILAEDPRVPVFPIASEADATRILKQAKKDRSNVRWKIVKKTTYRVEGTPP